MYGKLLILVIAFVVILIIVILTVYIILLKKELKKQADELRLTRQQSYNKQLTVSLFDKDLINLATEFNYNLDYQKQLKLEQEQAEVSMRQSISDIAHDLRTPLTVVKGNLQLLMKEQNLSEKGKDYLTISIEKSNVLKDMVDDFFELSVLESERILPEFSRLDITSVLVQFILDHEALIMEHELTPDIRFPEKSLFVMADDKMLERICSNLLNNIFQYAKGTFCVELKEIDQEWILLDFSNQVDREVDVNQLFERTYRGDKARQGKGAGLGLYIAKLLAGKQNMEIDACQEEDWLYFRLKMKRFE